MWAKLKTRVLSAVIGAVLLIAVFFANPIIFNVVVSLASVVIMYELYLTFSLEKKLPLLILGYVFALIILSTLFFDRAFFQAISGTPVLVIYIILLSITGVICHESIKFSDIAASIFIILYGVVFIYYLALLRSAENGIFLIFIPFIGAWMPDTFAYFAGNLFGKHKLIPKVSPKKTVEGAVGGLLGSVLMFFVYAFIVSFFGYKTNYMMLLVLSLICGVVSQFGDLIASLIKREYGKKDFGNLIPGHGGLLDRVDSLLFVTPLCYYFLNIFEVFYL